MPLDSLIQKLKKFIPQQLLEYLLPAYHWLWALVSAIYYRFPGKNIYVIFITGTKGKTTTAELVNTVLEENGHRTGLAGTLRFKVFDQEMPNKYKMSSPGRGILQKFLRGCVDEGCDVAVMEMTSQAVLNHRHRFLFPNVLVFTNLEPEHIEAHGSYENYREAKLKLADSLKQSPKIYKAIVSNLDDKEGKKFISRSGLNNVVDLSFSMTEIGRPYYKNGLRFTYQGERVVSKLQGEHNIKNILASLKVAEFFQVPLTDSIKALEEIPVIRGRLESIDNKQGLEIYVDYAHTPGSLRAVYETYKDKNIIGVLGNAGGGRDTWKRSEMAKIAEEYCHHIILTDEDPYDEDPQSIVDEMAKSIKEKDKLEIIMDRRSAIRKGLELAKETNNAVLLITGKGTDPYIMRANGEREPWDDASVVREELKKIN